ncbi:uncharacterized protein LOC143149427 isoform X2 [Ptiloglossa arizonensis]
MPASHYINIMNKSKYEQMLLMENSAFDEMSSSTIHDNCQFPYYRSSKNDGQFPDAVLVKDVGISCMLLNQSVPKISIPEANSYLVKQLKREYNDLSNITSKITAYTKDILNNLSKKNQRKTQMIKKLVSSKHAIASQYVDNKGNLCLKLRLISNAETQCNPTEIVKESDSTLLQDKYVSKGLCNQNSKNRIMYKDQMTVCKENFKLKHEKEIQTISSEKNVETNTLKSSSHSTSFIYNYLTMRTRKSSNDMKSTLINFDDMTKHQNSHKSNANKNRKEHSKRCNPTIYTNWKEISRSKQSKNNVLSTSFDKSREMMNTEEKIVQNQFFNSNLRNNVPDTEFHTVNVRIVKHNKKCV